jgi:chromosome segregation ATPase
MPSQSDSPKSDESNFTASEMRIDQPHPVRRAPILKSHERLAQPVAAGESAEPNAVAVGVEHSLELLREHAAQLADRLQSDQVALDRREAALAAQEADLEAKWQNARQWLAEQQQELDVRAESVAQREHDLLEREAMAEDRAIQLTQVREDALTERETRLVERETELQAATFQLQQRLTALDDDRAAWDERHEKLQVREALIETRHREIDQRQAQLYRDIDALTAEKARLGERMTEIEHRESKIAQWESQLQERGAELEKQTDALRERAGELEIGRAELRKATADLTSRAGELDAAERQLGYRQQEIETALARFERLGVTEEKMKMLQEEARKFAARRRYLDEAESQLETEKAELADAVRALLSERRQWEEQMVRERRSLSAQQQLATKEQLHRTEQLDQREAEIDARENALVNLQSELRATQREVLEMRLATEETWAQLASALAPASLTRSISQVRTKLADHYRTTLDEIAERSAQLEEVRRDLSQQLAALETQRQELSEWAERRHAEIETQASRLVAREQELDRQQQHYEQMESQWHIERTDYQGEIRRLLATLRDVEIEEARAA